MFTTRAMMAPLSQTLRMQTQMLRTRPASKVLQQTRGIKFQATPARMRPVPREEHSAHTISQRIRTLKKIPPELIPLGIVLGIAIFAAGYSMIRKFYTDGTLRLSRQGKQTSKPASEYHSS